MGIHFNKAIQSAEQANLVIAILGGATAHSYREIGLQGVDAGNLMDARIADPEGSSATPSALVSSVAYMNGSAAAFLSEASKNVEGAASAPIEMLPLAPPEVFAFQVSGTSEGSSESDYRTNPADSDFLSSASFMADPENGISAAATAIDTVAEEGFSLPESLLELVQRALDDAEANKNDISTDFDGSGQGQSNVREWIVDALQDVGTMTRDFLQTEVRGEGRQIVSDFVADMKSPLLAQLTDPVLEVDYYQVSADVINGLLDSAFEPIGSASLPRIGPLLDRPREELAGYLG